ncbi:MAG: hypothetical protein ABIT38_08215, partial [Gemmatimonadaceae bacterium]
TVLKPDIGAVVGREGKRSAREESISGRLVSPLRVASPRGGCSMQQRARPTHSGVANQTQ